MRNLTCRNSWLAFAALFFAASNAFGGTVLFLGDSLAAGLGVEEKQAFPALIEERIQAEHLPFEVINAGQSGDTTAGGLRRVGLGERSDHYPAQLSGGEQQRVALARAFINRPKILFADEPTGNLDAETSQGVIEIMLELNRNAGTALVLVTHDPEVARVTERTIRLRNGEMIE